MNTRNEILLRQELIKANIAGLIDLEKGTYFSPDERKKLAKEGKAMPDGSFPIRNEKDLRDAIKLASMAKNVSAAKSFIVKRSKQMDLEKLIPESWGIEKAKGTDKDGDGDVDSHDYMAAKDEAIKEAMSKKKIQKGAKMPIGSISRGRKKVAEGKWVDVKDTGNMPKKGDVVTYKDDKGSQKTGFVLKRMTNTFKGKKHTQFLIGDSRDSNINYATRISTTGGDSDKIKTVGEPNAAKQSKVELYAAVNQKYKTNFKPGSIDEFEDDSFRVELDDGDIKEIVRAETTR